MFLDYGVISGMSSGSADSTYDTNRVIVLRFGNFTEVENLRPILGRLDHAVDVIQIDTTAPMVVT